ncbi:MAG: hypothetical protein IJA10_12600 [Lachnospiraceae bacterium]|nr:hypothetical protein [Lachnospiraceae bacterium]
MKNYKKIPFNRIKDIESYVEKKLKAGHIIIQIRVNEDNKQIDELISYANDKECESYYRSLTDSDEQLRTCVISECMELYYAFKDEKREAGTCDIDIDADLQDVIDFYEFKKDIKDMKEHYSGESFQWKDYDDSSCHYEFYISLEKGDIANFGGCLEIDFVTEWMEEQGYYHK